MYQTHRQFAQYLLLNRYVEKLFNKYINNLYNYAHIKIYFWQCCKERYFKASTCEHLPLLCNCFIQWIFNKSKSDKLNIHWHRSFHKILPPYYNSIFNFLVLSKPTSFKLIFFWQRNNGLISYFSANTQKYLHFLLDKTSLYSLANFEGASFLSTSVTVKHLRFWQQLSTLSHSLIFYAILSKWTRSKQKGKCILIGQFFHPFMQWTVFPIFRFYSALIKVLCSSAESFVFILVFIISWYVFSWDF